MRILAAKTSFDISVKWVKGHSGIQDAVSFRDLWAIHNNAKADFWGQTRFEWTEPGRRGGASPEAALAAAVQSMDANRRAAAMFVRDVLDRMGARVHV